MDIHFWLFFLTANYPDVHCHVYDSEICISFHFLVQDIFGAVQAEAISSGFCIGSSNWVIKSKYEKVSGFVIFPYPIQC